MKYLFLTLCLMSSGSLSAQISKAPTAAEIAAKRRQADAVYESAQAKSVEESVSIERATPSLLGSSDYLVGPHGFVLIPKGAVIAEGKTVTLAKTAPIRGKLLEWSEFFRKHRSGLRLLPISEQQWMGEASLEPLKSRVEAARQNGYTTVTALNGGVVGLPDLHKLFPPKS